MKRGRTKRIEAAVPRYLRFFCRTFDAGIFTAASDLVARPEVAEFDRAELRAHLDWFGVHLATPKRFVRTTSKAFRQRAPVAVCWFRGGAREHIARAWDVVRLLDGNGVGVELLRTEHPGYVTWEDEHQIVAIPFADR